MEQNFGNNLPKDRIESGIARSIKGPEWSSGLGAMPPVKVDTNKENILSDLKKSGHFDALGLKPGCSDAESLSRSEMIILTLFRYNDVSHTEISEKVNQCQRDIVFRNFIVRTYIEQDLDRSLVTHKIPSPADKLTFIDECLERASFLKLRQQGDLAFESAVNWLTNQKALLKGAWHSAAKLKS